MKIRCVIAISCNYCSPISRATNLITSDSQGTLLSNFRATGCVRFSHKGNENLETQNVRYGVFADWMT